MPILGRERRRLVRFLPYGAWVYNGKVTKVLPTADPETQRHLVDLVVTDIEPEKLIPGITGEVSIEVGRHPAKSIIPRRALLNENVYVVKNGKVELRPVKKGFVWLTGVEITEGLEPGDLVIVEDLDSFHDGDSVGNAGAAFRRLLQEEVGRFTGCHRTSASRSAF